MALNPPMYNAVTPMAKTGEFFLLEREGLAFKVDSEGFPTLSSSSGKLFLTTKRLVFACTTPVKLSDGAQFEAFELPLKDIDKEKFNQPIFGANNLTGSAKPTPGMGLFADAHFKLTFNKGGFGTFYRLFARALVEERTPTAQSISSFIMSGDFSKVAVVDPNDPSVVYFEQPSFPKVSDSQSSDADQEDHKS